MCADGGKRVSNCIKKALHFIVKHPGWTQGEHDDYYSHLVKREHTKMFNQCYKNGYAIWVRRPDWRCNVTGDICLVWFPTQKGIEYLAANPPDWSQGPKRPKVVQTGRALNNNGVH